VIDRYKPGLFLEVRDKKEDINHVRSDLLRFCGLEITTKASNILSIVLLIFTAISKIDVLLRLPTRPQLIFAFLISLLITGAAYFLFRLWKWSQLADIILIVEPRDPKHFEKKKKNNEKEMEEWLKKKYRCDPKIEKKIEQNMVKYGFGIHHRLLWSAYRVFNKEHEFLSKLTSKKGRLVLCVILCLAIFFIIDLWIFQTGFSDSIRKRILSSF